MDVRISHCDSQSKLCFLNGCVRRGDLLFLLEEFRGIVLTSLCPFSFRTTQGPVQEISLAMPKLRRYSLTSGAPKGANSLGLDCPRLKCS